MCDWWLKDSIKSASFDDHYDLGKKLGRDFLEELECKRKLEEIAAQHPLSGVVLVSGQIQIDGSQAVLGSQEGLEEESVRSFYGSTWSVKAGSTSSAQGSGAIGDTGSSKSVKSTSTQGSNRGSMKSVKSGSQRSVKQGSNGSVREASAAVAMGGSGAASIQSTEEGAAPVTTDSRAEGSLQQIPEEPNAETPAPEEKQPSVEASKQSMKATEEAETREIGGSGQSFHASQKSVTPDDAVTEEAAEGGAVSADGAAEGAEGGEGVEGGEGEGDEGSAAGGSVRASNASMARSGSSKSARSSVRSGEASYKSVGNNLMSLSYGSDMSLLPLIGARSQSSTRSPPPPLTSLQRLEQIVEEENEKNKDLVSGATAVVHMCTHKGTRENWAVKIIEKQENRKGIARECGILFKIMNPNIIRLKEVYESESTIWMVLELVEGGELFDRIVSKGYYSEKDAASAIKDVLEALKYLHEYNIVHRDLKPENLLLSTMSDDATVKLADFGLAEVHHNEVRMNLVCGTPGYCAPEVIKPGVGYDQKVDMWSVGVILYILLCGYEPFYAETDAEIYKRILKGDYTFDEKFWDDISENAKDLVRKLLVRDPKKRLSAAQALNHKWVQGKAVKTNPMEETQRKLKEFQARKKLKAVTAAIHLASGWQMMAQNEESQMMDAGSMMQTLGSQQNVSGVCILGGSMGSGIAGMLADAASNMQQGSLQSTQASGTGWNSGSVPQMEQQSFGQTQESLQQMQQASLQGMSQGSVPQMDFDMQEGSQPAFSTSQQNADLQNNNATLSQNSMAF